MSDVNIITIRAKTKPHKVLNDLRIGRRGLTFGTVENIAKQYGVKFTIDENDPRVMLFTAPVKQMQAFVEKLHFSGIEYRSS